MKSLLYCFIFIIIPSFSGFAQSSYADSILENAIVYFKQKKSQIRIHEAKEHLDSVRVYFDSTNTTAAKLERVFKVIEKDPALLKLEEARIKNLSRSETHPALLYPNNVHITSLLLFLLSLFYSWWVKKKREALKIKLNKVLMEKKNQENSIHDLFQSSKMLKEELEEVNKQIEENRKNFHDSLQLANQEKNLEEERFVIEVKNLNQILKNRKISLAELGKNYDRLNKKYGHLIKIDEEYDSKKVELDSLKTEIERSQKVYTSLKHDVDIMKDDYEISEFGIYEPHYTFETSENYKIERAQIIDRRKALVRNKEALNGSKSWRSKSLSRENKTFYSNLEKIILRAFNGECDKYVDDVAWNNILRFEERMKKSYEAINKLGVQEGLTISPKYLSLRLEELRLSHEYDKKREEEKETQRRIREQIRDEELAQKEFERAQKQAAKEQRYYEEALRLAEAKFASANQEEKLKFKNELDELKDKLREAEDRGKRALSLAQQTKTGNVYIVSNIGSFGENIYKIGMTRRLDPMDRVKELGDASVPFTFDVHAIIRSNNAPELEHQLHKTFEKHRVNRVNMRKEFFNINLERIKQVVENHNGNIEFTKDFTLDHEAQEYRETLELRKKDGAMVK